MTNVTIDGVRESAPAQPSRLTAYASTRQDYDLRAEVDKARQLVRLAVKQQFEALALLAAPNLMEAGGIGHRREQLIVLAETEVGQLCARGERDPLELDDDPTGGPFGEPASVDREPV